MPHKPSDLGSFPIIQIRVEGEAQLYKIILWPLNAFHGSQHVHAQTMHTQWEGSVFILYILKIEVVLLYSHFTYDKSKVERILSRNKYNK